jgi:hypothetical protein
MIRQTLSPDVTASDVNCLAAAVKPKDMTEPAAVIVGRNNFSDPVTLPRAPFCWSEKK